MILGARNSILKPSQKKLLILDSSAAELKGSSVRWVRIPIFGQRVPNMSSNSGNARGGISSPIHLTGDEWNQEGCNEII